MAGKKAGAKASTKVAPLTTADVPAPTAAAKEKDKEEGPATYRVDLGESIPHQAPIPTATDKK